MTREDKIAKIKQLRKDGKSYDEIAKAMKLSPQRVGYYVRTIEGKKTKSATKKTTAKKSVATKSGSKKIAPRKGERASEAAMRLAKPALDKLKKTETKGAQRAREASEAFGKSRGLTKPEPKPDLAAAAAAVQS